MRQTVTHRFPRKIDLPWKINPKSFLRFLVFFHLLTAIPQVEILAHEIPHNSLKREIIKNQGPDLSILDLIFPESCSEVGAEISIYAVIQNLGDESANVFVDLSYNQDNIWVGIGGASVTVEPGLEFEIEFPWTVAVPNAEIRADIIGSIPEDLSPDNNSFQAFLENDSNPPVALAKNVTLELDQNGQATLTPDMVDNGSYDIGCGIEQKTIDISEFDCQDLNANLIGILTVTDFSGNSSSAQFEVQILDKLGPELILPANLTISTDLESCFATNVDLGSAQATDNCTGPVSISNDAPSSFPIGQTEVTWTAVDESGNSTTGIQLVTVEDQNAPVLFDIADLTVNTDPGICTASNVDLGEVSAQDACGAVTLTNDAPEVFPIGETLVTWVAEDESGNQNEGIQRVTVVDMEAPVVITQNLVFEITEGEVITLDPAQVDNGSADNCQISTMTLSQTQFDQTNEGENTITLTVTDISGNQSSESAVITINVIQNCQIEAIAQDIAVELDRNGVASITTRDVDNGSYSTCGRLTSISLSQDLFTCADVGTVNVQMTVQDSEGNEAITDFNVTVIDTALPVIDKTPKSLIDYLPLEGSLFLKDFRLDYLATDNCSVVTFEQNPIPGTEITMTGTYPITLTAMDGNGNTVEASFDLVVLLEGTKGKGKGKGPNKTISSTSLLTVPWNTPFDSLSKYDFELFANDHPIEVNWNVENYNGLVPGFYQISGKPKTLVLNRLMEDIIKMNVLVENKPLPLDIETDQTILPEKVVKDQVLANLSTIDEVDNIHSYQLSDHDLVYLTGSQIRWKGEAGRIKEPVNLKVISTDRANQSIERNLTLRIDDLPINLQVYPNPSTRYATIRVDFSGEAPVTIKVFDAIGRLAMEKESLQSNSYKHQIDMGLLSNGIYYVQVQVGQFILTKRLVKEN